MNRLAPIAAIFALAWLMPGAGEAKAVSTFQAAITEVEGPGEPVGPRQTRLAGWFGDGVAWLFGAEDGASGSTSADGRTSARAKASLVRPGTARVDDPPPSSERTSLSRSMASSDSQTSRTEETIAPDRGDSLDPLTVLATGLQDDRSGAAIESILSNSEPRTMRAAGDPIAGLLGGSDDHNRNRTHSLLAVTDEAAIPDPIGAALMSAPSSSESGDIAGILLRTAEASAGPPRAKPVPPSRSDSTPAPAAGVGLSRIDRMIGQMLILGFQGRSAGQGWPRHLADQLARGEVGGVLLLRHNIGDRREVRGLTGLFANATADPPPFVALDQEGGSVQRLKRGIGFTSRAAAQDVAARHSPGAAEELYAGLADDLRDWGINLNLAPVLDVNLEPRNPVIAKYKRAFSHDPDIVANYGAAFVRGHRTHGVATALKHFPGHGSSIADTHNGFVDISQTWRGTPELEPFRRLIGENLVDMVMIGHLHVAKAGVANGKALPATLSEPVIEGELRRGLGYDGVVITDDLDMAAIRRNFGFEDALMRAVMAGNDLIVLSNSAKPDRDLPARVRRILKRHAESDPRVLARIEESYRRVIALKQTRLGRNGRRADARPERIEHLLLPEPQ